MVIEPVKLLIVFFRQERALFLFQDIAVKFSNKFSSFDFDPIRASLYYMYIIVKDREVMKLGEIIEFLDKFHRHSPHIIQKKTFYRVINSLKLLVCFEFPMR
jgi:hypothetical protein